MTRSCRSQNRIRSGTRAIVPSSLRISQITPAGDQPARLARSTAASVWPRRSRTPPARARSGKTCPGTAKSSRRVRGSMAALIVCARSWAEIPVVRPRPFTSIDTVKAVPPTASLVRHLIKAQLVEPLFAHRETDETPPVGRHEVDGLRRDRVRRHQEIALVLAVDVVDDDDHASRSQLADRIFDVRKRA